MPQASSLRVKMQGGPKLVHKLDENVTLAGPWTAAMCDVRRIAVDETRKRTPLLSGRLEASVSGKVDARPVPHYVVLTAGAENKGYRYGFALEAGHAKRKHGKEQYQFHYAGYRASTRHWFSGVRAKINARIEPILQAAARAVEASWVR